MKIKLTNRYFGNTKNGSIKTQYLALCVESQYSKEVATIIGQGLENGEVLQRWKNVKLLPTRPSLHDSFDKEKFFNVLQIHNKVLRETTRVTIKNMWVGDYNLRHDDELLRAMGVTCQKYSFRQLILEAAKQQRIDVRDFYVAGSQAHVVYNTTNFTKTCEFVDIFLEICKEKYGTTDFAKQMRFVDPTDERRHPVRVTRPIYTSSKGVDDMIRNIGNGIKLIKAPNKTVKTFPSHKNERLWSQVLITPSRQDSNTSPLTNDTDSKIRNLHNEVNELKRIMENKTQKNKEKIEMLTETVTELKEGLKMSMIQQEQMNQTIMEAIGLMQRQMAEITAAQTKIQTMFAKMSGVYSPAYRQQDSQPITQPPYTNNMNNEESSDEDDMDFNMTNLKRTREERVYDIVDMKQTLTNNGKRIDTLKTPERSNRTERSNKLAMSDPPESKRKGHESP